MDVKSAELASFFPCEHSPLATKESSDRAWHYLVDPASSHMLVSRIKLKIKFLNES